MATKKILWSLLIIAVSAFSTKLLGYDVNKTALFIIEALFLTGILAAGYALFMKLFVKRNTFYTYFGNSFFYLVILVAIIKPASQFLIKNIVQASRPMLSQQKTKSDSIKIFLNKIPEVLNSINRFCPKDIDNSTEMRRVSFDGNDTSFRFIYRLKGYKSEDINAGLLEKEIKDALTGTFYKDSSLLELHNNAVNVSFDILDQDSVFLFRVLFPSYKYKSP